MNKSKVLCVGVGQCGNNIVSEMLKKDKRYTGLFINSNYTDLEGLYGIEPNNNNVVIFNGLNGSGKDRKIAKRYLQNQLEIVVDAIMNYPTRNIINVFCSCDGGTGSGSVPALIALLKRIPNKTINLIAALPNYETANLLSLENALDFWNDIFQEQTTKSGMKYKVEDYLNDIKFIDNSKFGGSYSKINKAVVDAIDTAYSIVGKDIDGNIDVADSQKVNLFKGFSNVLLLQPNLDIEEAIRRASNESVFISTMDSKCIYAAVSCQRSYDKNKILSHLKVEVESFSTYNDKFNVIVQAGLKPIPMYAIERISKRRETLLNQIKQVEYDTVKTINYSKDVNETVDTIDEPLSVTDIDSLIESLDDIF